MRNKRSFIPASLGGMDHLESRVVLSHGPVFVHGAALLTAHAYSKTTNEIRAAFQHFGKGQDYNRLTSDLAKATSRIPYHKSSGLDDSMAGIVSQMHDDITSKVDKPVITAYQSAMSTLKDTVQSGMSDGSIATSR